MSRKQELHPRTAAINKVQKNSSRHCKNKALQWLTQQFPEAFDNSLRIRPLKQGIMDDILAFAEQAAAAGISKSKLREAVVIFTRRVDYLTCLKAREMRIDLQGNPVAQVSEEEAERAANKIRKRVEKSIRNAKKAAPVKSPAFYGDWDDAPTAAASREPRMPIYPPKPTTVATATPAKTTTVMIKNKPSRAYDPGAVARLKEKLGLSMQREDDKALSE